MPISLYIVCYTCIHACTSIAIQYAFKIKAAISKKIENIANIIIAMHACSIYSYNYIAICTKIDNFIISRSM